MPRAHFYRPITNEKGDLIVGATVQVLDPATETSYTGSLYVDEETTEALGNPFVCNDGIIDFYIDQPQIVDIKITTLSGAIKMAKNMPVTGLTASEVDIAAVIAAAEAATAAAEAAAEAASGAQDLDDLSDVNTGGSPPGTGAVLVGEAGLYVPRLGTQLFDAAGSAAAAEAAAKAASQPFSTHLTAIAALTTTPYGRGLLTKSNSAALMTEISPASDAVAGKVELATPAETLTGTDTSRAVTPAGVKAVFDTVPGIADLADVAFTGNAADLVGTIPTALLPPLAINETTVVSDQATMLALVAQRGDMAIRSDNGKTYVLATDNPAVLANWKEITASGAVQSVAGKTGVVSLVKADVGLSNVDNTSDLAKPISTAMQTALSGKENAIAAGTGTQYWRGDKTWQTLNAAAVGLGNVNNTSDAAKPISTATQAALDAKASKVGGLVPVAEIPTLDSAKIGTGRLASYVPVIGDLNAANDTGWYTANGSTAANIPQTGAYNWMIETIALSANTAIQTATPVEVLTATDQNRWRRRKTGGTWGSWYTIEDAQTALDTRYYTRAQVDTEIAEAYDAAVPGGEMGYAARTSVFTTTNVTDFNTAASALISTFSVTVTGEGDPVDIVFNTLAASSATNNSVVSYLVVNGSATGTIQGASRVFSLSGGEPMGLFMRRRAILTNGVTYTFQVGISQERAGTVTLSATSQIPTELSVTRR